MVGYWRGVRLACEPGTEALDFNRDDLRATIRAHGIAVHAEAADVLLHGRRLAAAAVAATPPYTTHARQHHQRRCIHPEIRDSATQADAITPCSRLFCSTKVTRSVKKQSLRAHPHR